MEVSRTIRSRLTGALCALLFVALSCYGQTVSATLLGTITDVTGGVIANAKMTITEVNTGVSRSGLTDESGNYTFRNLPPGQYAVTVEASGFEPGARFERSWIKTKPGLVPHGRKRS